MANVSHWATIEPFLRPENTPQWVDGEDRTRVASYDAYESIYWTAPKAYQIQLRGENNQPIYIPSGRKIVNTAHRYLAPGFNVTTDPNFGSPAEQADAQLWLTEFMRRERFLSKFSANKLEGLTKGDWLFHIFADEERAEGSRVSIFPLDPATYFPEYEGGDQVDSVIAVHLVQSFQDGNEPAVLKLKYTKVTETGGPSQIQVDQTVHPIDEWGQPQTDMALTTVRSLDSFVLPDVVDAIPVYHIPNTYDPSFGWGSSEMRGVEILMRAISQGATDEDLTLVLEGLGLYVTTAGAPINEDTDEVMPWNLGPARVVEIPDGKDFKRVNGAGSITPYQDHLSFLIGELEDATNTDAVSRGRVDVTVAESGIALALRLAPLFASMQEKERVITDVVTQMMYDLRKWFMGFEAPLGGLEEIRWVPTYGDRMPVNKKQVFDQVMTMITATPVPVISTAEGRRLLKNIGWEFSPDETLNNEILAEQSAVAGATADAVAARVGGDVATLTDDGGVDEG